MSSGNSGRWLLCFFCLNLSTVVSCCFVFFSGDLIRHHQADLEHGGASTVSHSPVADRFQSGKVGKPLASQKSRDASKPLGKELKSAIARSICMF